MTQWQTFVVNQQRLAVSSPKRVCIDIQPYGSTQAPERTDILHIGGFSDAVFNVVASYLGNDTGRFVAQVNNGSPMDRELISTGKFLSLVLRHHPEKIGISLDNDGWVMIDDLLAAANRSGKKLTRPLLDRVVRENDKQRFAISSDGTRIRANQGHSVEVDLGLQPVQPPALLYHGTVARFLDSIRDSGLERGSRQYVHLSPDVETARKVGQRRGKPVVLVVESRRMWQDGHMFYQAENGVWLTDAVPAEYLRCE